MNSKTVIIGAGFAGRQACRALCRTDAEVILFDPGADTVMLPALPDLAGGWVAEEILSRPLTELLPRKVQYIRRAVSSIDLDQKTVTADDGAVYSFDHLLLASGSIADFHGFNRHLDAVHRLDSLESALRIRDEFRVYLSDCAQPHLVIAGGGYTGLELAASLRFRSIADGRPCRVTVADPSKKILSFLSETEQKRMIAFLEQNGIQVLNECRVSDFDGQNVEVGGKTLEQVFFCWAGGSKLAVPEIKGSVNQLRDGRLTVRPDLSLPGYPDVFAAGDSAAVLQNGQPLRKAVNFAWYGGRCAGKNIAARMQGRKTKPFKPVDLGWVIPLHRESTGKMLSVFALRGRPGLMLHYFMCGLRNYSLENFLGFTKISIKLFGKETTS
jgi:NADH dehydrogenase